MVSLMVIPIGQSFGFHYNDNIEASTSSCYQKHGIRISGVTEGEHIFYEYNFEAEGWYEEGQVEEDGRVFVDIPIPRNENNYTIEMVVKNSVPKDGGEHVIDTVYEREINMEVSESSNPASCGFFPANILRYISIFVIVILLVISIYLRHKRSEKVILD